MDDLTLLEYVGAFEVAVTGIIDVAAETPLDAAVPTCPEWTLADLIRHCGEVHRWVSDVVGHERSSLRDVDPDYLGELPADDELVGWFRDGAARLAGLLRAADVDALIATFLTDPALPPPRFWARRQAHEMIIHHVDACSAAGRLPEIWPSLAVDGIDEFITGFVPRRTTRLHRSPAVSLRIVAVDGLGGRRSWVLTVSDEVPVAVREAAGEVACTVEGRAADVLLALWNRQDLGEVRVSGDVGVITDLRDHVRIRRS